MNLKTVIKTALKDKDKTQRWLADRLEMNEKTFSGKLIGNSFSADELLFIANILDIDLNALKSEIKPKKVKDNMRKIVLYLHDQTGDAIDNVLAESTPDKHSLASWLWDHSIEVTNILEQPIDEGWMTDEDFDEDNQETDE